MATVTELARRAAGRNGSDHDDPAMTDEEREIAAAMSATPDDDDLGEAGGRSLEDHAAEEDDGQQLIDLGGHLNLSVKGKKPTDSEVKVKAVSTPVLGQLGDKGDDETITMIVRGRLDEIRIVSKRDGDGKVISKSRRHVLTPVSFTVVNEDDVADLIENAGGRV